MWKYKCIQSAVCIQCCLYTVLFVYKCCLYTVLFVYSGRYGVYIVRGDTYSTAMVQHMAHVRRIYIQI